MAQKEGKPIEFYLELLVKNYFGSMLVTDHRGRFLYVSDGTCQLLDIPRETLLKISIYDTLQGYCYATSASTIKTLETRQEALSFHTVQVRGERKNVLAFSRPYFDGGGVLRYVMTYSWDEKELYALLEKFNNERDNVRKVIRFMQDIDHVAGSFIAESRVMQELLEYSEHIAAVDSNVIIYGESGSGKELFAKYIHAKSGRADQVFIPINCAAMPRPCWRPRCSAMKRVPSPAVCGTGKSACSSLPTRVRSSWTRLAKCLRSSRPSSSASLRPGRSSGWGAIGF